MQIFAHMSQWHVAPNLIASSAALAACDKGSQWQQALWTLRGLGTEDAPALCSALSACGKASQWLLALQLFRQTKAGSCAGGDVVHDARDPIYIYNYIYKA